jgi:hypothetical protein
MTLNRSMRLHLVCFADARYRPAQRRLVNSARAAGIDEVHGYTCEDLRADPFFAENSAILSLPRGAGYWLWKPFYIARVLEKVRPGDFVLYVDSGAELISDVRPLARLCESQTDGVMVFSVDRRLNRYWTKRDAFVLMGCDEAKYYNADQAFGTICGIIRNENSVKFVQQWLTLSRDPRLLTDQDNTCGLPNHRDFIEHRHDQSVLSLLAAREGRYLFRDPSQFGNHKKLPYLRVAREYLEMPYDQHPCERSTYPTIINHHRNPSAERPPTFNPFDTILVRKLRRAFRIIRPKTLPNAYFEPKAISQCILKNRATLREVRNWIDESAYSSSQFNYGISELERPFANANIGPQMTHADVLVYLTTFFSNPPSYLEIGVSVGKNFLQIMNSVKTAGITGFDIEEINPALARTLDKLNRSEWPVGPTSLKIGRSSLTQFVHRPSGNEVRYLAGDVYDEQAWERLRGNEFSIIFLDVLHLPELPMHEWDMIEDLDLLSRGEFVLVCNNLGGTMSLAFQRVADRVRRHLATDDLVCFEVPLRGSFGAYKWYQHVGFIIRLNRLPESIRRRSVAGGAACGLNI